MLHFFSLRVKTEKDERHSQVRLKLRAPQSSPRVGHCEIVTLQMKTVMEKVGTGLFLGFLLHN